MMESNRLNDGSSMVCSLENARIFHIHPPLPFFACGKKVKTQGSAPCLWRRSHHSLEKTFAELTCEDCSLTRVQIVLRFISAASQLKKRRHTCTLQPRRRRKASLHHAKRNFSQKPPGFSSHLHFARKPKHITINIWYINSISPRLLHEPEPARCLHRTEPGSHNIHQRY